MSAVRRARLGNLGQGVRDCTRCPLYRNTTQGVVGEGAAPAAVMLVGEQPGDREDLAGKPFVGPAGQILDRALADAGIARPRLFVTNAVKHFKNEPRGKRRLHKRPNAYEIDQCKWWLDKEIAIIRPRVIVALGATAARSLLGRAVSIARESRTIHDLPDGARLVVTIHPSYVLRLRDERARRNAYDALVAALARAREAAALTRAAPAREAA